jgi:hypothetical protein
VDKIFPDDSVAIIIIDEDEDGDEGDEKEGTIERRRYPEREPPLPLAMTLPLQR